MASLSNRTSKTAVMVLQRVLSRGVRPGGVTDAVNLSTCSSFLMKEAVLPVPPPVEQTPRL